MADNLPAARPSRPMMIKNLAPSLPERGKIKIGVKGKMMKSSSGTEFQPPKKLDHFVITTMVRDETNNFAVDEDLHKKFGPAPKELPIRLLYDDPTLNFPTRLAAYKGKTLWCSGDGEQASRLDEDAKVYKPCPCPCPRIDFGYAGKDKCKFNGVLSALIDGAGGVGGVWKFRTTSYNSVRGLLSSMAFIRGVTGGPLANLPLKLTVGPKQVQDPTGRAQTIFVVGVEFPGDIAALQQAGHKIALERSKTHVNIQHIEAEARAMLTFLPKDTPLPGDDNDDIVEEFYPENITEAALGVEAMVGRPTRESAQQDAPQPVRNFMLKAGGTEVMGMTSGDFSDALIRALTSTPASQVDAIWQQNAAMIAALPDGGAQIRKVYDAIKAKQPQPVEDSYTLVDEAGEPKSTHKTPDAWSRAFWDAIKPNDKGAQTKSNVMYVHHNSDVYLDTMRDLTEDDALVTQIDDAIRAITKIVAEEEAAREAAKTKPKEAAPVTQAESAPAPTPAAPAAPERLAAPTKNGKVESAGYLTMFVAAIEACEKPEDVATRVRLEEPNLKSVVPGTRRVCMQKGLARWTALGGAIETWPEATKPS